LSVCLGRRGLRNDDRGQRAHPICSLWQLSNGGPIDDQGRCNGLFDHYGVYIGRSQVIHFSGGKIIKTSLRKFSDYDEKMIQPFLTTGFGGIISFFCNRDVIVDVMAFDSSAIASITDKDCVKRADLTIGKTDYNFLFKNCEHFAVWCRTGVAESSQAFGLKSDDFGLATASLTRLITHLTHSSVGMVKSRSVRVD
jgi:hypothetical protein